MVRHQSTPRLSSIVLVQTDTTVGFVSQNHTRLAEIKYRPQEKPFITVLNSSRVDPRVKPEDDEVHSQLDWESIPRVPNKYKKELRRAKKTTFIIKNKAFRISRDAYQSQLLRNTSWHYSTSANETNKKFDREFCELNTDIIIENIHGLQELGASKLIKLTNYKKRQLR